MEIDVRKTHIYNFLTCGGKKLVMLKNGTCSLEPDVLADQANGVLNYLKGKGFNYAKVAIILDVAKDATKETMLNQTL